MIRARIPSIHINATWMWWPSLVRCRQCIPQKGFDGERLVARWIHWKIFGINLRCLFTCKHKSRCAWKCSHAHMHARGTHDQKHRYNDNTESNAFAMVLPSCGNYKSQRWLNGLNGVSSLASLSLPLCPVVNVQSGLSDLLGDPSHALAILLKATALLFPGWFLPFVLLLPECYGAIPESEWFTSDWNWLHTVLKLQKSENKAEAGSGATLCSASEMVP